MVLFSSIAKYPEVIWLTPEVSGSSFARVFRVVLTVTLDFLGAVYVLQHLYTIAPAGGINGYWV
jgi:hypothetical protein